MYIVFVIYLYCWTFTGILSLFFLQNEKHCGIRVSARVPLKRQIGLLLSKTQAYKLQLMAVRFQSV